MAEEDDKRIESHRFAHFPITTPRCRNLYLSLTSLIIIEISGYVQMNYVSKATENVKFSILQ